MSKYHTLKDVANDETNINFLDNGLIEIINKDIDTGLSIDNFFKLENLVPHLDVFKEITKMIEDYANKNATRSDHPVSQGVYIQLFDEETPIFISMTQVELGCFTRHIQRFDNDPFVFVRVKTQETEKYYNFKNIKEITIQGAN